MKKSWNQLGVISLRTVAIIVVFILIFAIVISVWLIFNPVIPEGIEPFEGNGRGDNFGWTIEDEDLPALEYQRELRPEVWAGVYIWEDGRPVTFFGSPPSPGRSSTLSELREKVLNELNSQHCQIATDTNSYDCIGQMTDLLFIIDSIPETCDVLFKPIYCEDLG